MNNFKEWLSDNLRYFMLAGIIILVLAAAIFGINAYSKLSNNTDKKDTATEQETPQTETKREETETKESETETKKAAETEKQTEKMKETEETEETEAVTEAVTEPQLAAAPQTEAVPETEAEPQTEPAPVYLTLKSACYIRSGPSYEAEIIGEYWGGQTVRFIEDAGGWYKVEVDGMIGYMGARFF